MKKRKDSFFGIHLDYHAKPEYGIQGETLKEKDIRRICRELKPDFIQIDCKGHLGLLILPSWEMPSRKILIMTNAGSITENCTAVICVAMFAPCEILAENGEQMAQLCQDQIASGYSLAANIGKCRRQSYG